MDDVSVHTVRMATEWSPRVAELRHRRREIRKELARIRWWVRLLNARRDLHVARLSGPGETGAIDLDSAWEALAADAPTSRELAQCLWGNDGGDAPASIDQIDGYLVRLTAYEERVNDNLTSVTQEMVNAMGAEHRALASKVGHG